MGLKNYKFMSIDVETTGLDWTVCKLHGIGVGYAEDNIKYYPSWDVPDFVRRDLADPTITKTGHNFHAFDGKVLRQHGFEVNGSIDDTMVTENLIDDGQSLGLKNLSIKYFGPESLEKKAKLDRYIAQNKAGNIAGLCAMDLLDPKHPHCEIIAAYCEEDVLNHMRILFLGFKKLRAIDKILKEPKFGFKKSPWDYYVEEARPLEKVLFDIETRGVRIDMAQVARVKENETKNLIEIGRVLSKIMVNRIKSVELEIYNMAVSKAVTLKAQAKLSVGMDKCKFSWTNNNHVGLLFYKYCDLPKELVFKTDTGKYRTDKTALGDIRKRLPKGHPFGKLLGLFLKYRLHSKIVSTYTGSNKKGIISKIRELSPGNFRIFPTYHQTSGTGRLKSSNPNMQNIKRDSEIKKFFIPDREDEVFDSADYSQIELRVGAHLSKDSVLCKLYREGVDVHLVTASRLFGREIAKSDDLERQAGKRTNFLTIFDGKAHRLQAALLADTGKDFDIKECKEFIRAWFELYPEVRQYLDEQLEFFKKYKFCISEAGRVRRLPDIVFGHDLEWRKIGPRWQPVYTGPQNLVSDLITQIRKEQPRYKHREIPQDIISQAAYRRYSHAVKMGYNQPIQGLAATMAKRAMIQLHNAGRVIANQVHDELVVSRKKSDLAAQRQVIDIMENVWPLIIPVVVDVKTVKSFHPSDKVGK